MGPDDGREPKPRPRESVLSRDGGELPPAERLREARKVPAFAVARAGLAREDRTELLHEEGCTDLVAGGPQFQRPGEVERACFGPALASDDQPVDRLQCEWVLRLPVSNRLPRRGSAEMKRTAAGTARRALARQVKRLFSIETPSQTFA
jgi:hypothetical protein